MSIELGKAGIWDRYSVFATQDASELAALGEALEVLGYSAVWLGMAEADLQVVNPLLSKTKELKFATGILNIWREKPDAVAQGFAAVDAKDRVILGIGAGHREINADENFAKPFSAVQDYLGQLDVPKDNIALAALGDRMLKLAAERTAGAHPYLVTPEYTAHARSVLGSGPLLAPEQKIVLLTDPVEARMTARQGLEMYLQLENYRANLRRLGFTDEDFADGGSDRLVDALVAWGDEQKILGRLQEHLDAGADHVCIQVLRGKMEIFPLETFRIMAPALRDLK